MHKTAVCTIERLAYQWCAISICVDIPCFIVIRVFHIVLCNVFKAATSSLCGDSGHNLSIAEIDANDLFVVRHACCPCATA